MNILAADGAPGKRPGQSGPEWPGAATAGGRDGGAGWQVAGGTVDRVGDDGAYVRDTRYLNARITADGRDGWPVEPGRYRLAVARACPWANRAIIVRRLLGLENAISIAMAGPVQDDRSWTFDLDPGGRDPVLGIRFLGEAYEKRETNYPVVSACRRSSTSRAGSS